MTIPKLSLKAKLLVGLITLSLASLVYLFFSTRSNQTQVPTWKSIQVGKDTKNQVLQKLGPSLSASVSASGWEQLNYASDNQYWPHQVLFEKNKSTLVRERILRTQSGELQKYIARFGQPDAVLNNNLTGLDLYLHVFSQNGLAVNANPTTGTVFEIWYFPPTTLEKFQLQYLQEIGGYPERERF